MFASGIRANRFCSALLAILLVTVITGCGGGSGGGVNPPPQIPPTPTGLVATGGNAQVSLTWNASSGATSYNVKRGTATGGPYTTIHSPTTNSYTDTTVTNGTPYFYVVSAVNSGGESANSSEATATPSASTAIQVTVDTHANRHAIGPYVYGGAYPQDASTVTDSGLSVVRWGGNATSTYNWQLYTYNADNDYYFEDFNSSGFNGGADGNSTQFITDVKAAGSNPLMTMVMLNWVAKSAENGSNGHWSYSVAKYGAQCHVDPYNTDAGNGVRSDCTTQLTADPNDAYFPLLDDHTATCPSGTTCYYRNDWTAALATAFGGSAQHFYDMDNEIDIWGGTHIDIHPTPTTYQELRDTYLTEARNLKTWDPAAIRLGPVSCCWWFYWNSATGGSDKTSHGGLDFLPWWLNDVYWSDQAAGTRSVDVFDIHAYANGPDTSSYNQIQKRAAAIRVYRDWWDPTYISESSTVNQTYTTQIQPLGFLNTKNSTQGIAFVIPRMRALVNTIYPGTPLSITEWSAEFAGASDFSTALNDAEGYGILGRERVYLASRWTAPSSANSNYQVLKLYTNYDGAHHSFGTTSVSATNNGDPSLFSVFAALSSTGSALTIMVVNGDPANAANVTFALNHFAPSTFTSYTLSQSSPTSIVASNSQAWSATQSFPAYSATLLVISGTPTATAAEWDLNPDAIRAPAGGTVTLAPKIVSTTGTVTLNTVVFDTFYTGGAAQSGNGGCTAAITASQLTTTLDGAITLTAGTTSTAPGFYHFIVTGTDGNGGTQTQGGWLLVGNPPATLTKTGDNQSGTHGTTLNLSVTLAPGTSGGTATGASIFFTTDSGSLSQRIVTTNGSGVAAVVLTLPASAGSVHVTAEGPYDLGHPKVTFTETSN